MIGYNSRLDEIQAAILNVKINYVQSFIKKRKHVASIYNEHIKNEKIILPYAHINANHSYNQYTIRIKNRKKLEKYLNKNNVPFGIYYSKPIYSYNAYRSKCYETLPMAEKVSKQCLSLPIYPELTDNQINYLIDKIKDFF